MAASFFLLFLSLFHPGQVFNAAIAGIIAPKIMEEDVARAAAKLAIGDGKLVGGLFSLWYVSGGTHWYNIWDDVLTDDNTGLDLASYLKRFED